jgi:hypothetical protein
MTLEERIVDWDTKAEARGYLYRAVIWNPKNRDYMRWHKRMKNKNLVTQSRGHFENSATGNPVRFKHRVHALYAELRWGQTSRQREFLVTRP